MNPISPKKLLLTKWTATSPIKKEKHFLVAKVIQPENPTDQIELIDLEAVYSGNTYRISWHDLKDADKFLQGWH